jgi:hypothetical protein
MSNPPVTIVDAGILREAEEGLAQTILIFKEIGLTDVMIAQLFRGAADGLDPKIIVPSNEHLH